MKTLGRYEIRDRIGEGAMSDVYRAYDPQINRILAIKVLKAELCHNKELTARFVREASAAGTLSHPSIVTVYDVGQAEGQPYIAMELLEGRPLDKVEGKLSVETVVAIGIQLAEALSYAHAEGVIHRDIKPSNIVLANDGASIKILDFGIARMSDDERPGDASAGLKTQIGQVLGTPRYMSPEQALGETVDGRSDLFSVGLVLYEFVTGVKAFSGSNATTLGLQIALKDPTPIAELAPECPRGLQSIIAKLLAKKPQQRFAGGTQLAHALRREQQLYAGLLESRRRSRHLPLQLRIMLIAATIVAVALWAGGEVVLLRLNAALQQVSLTSGSSIASFAANNAALHVVDNAALPPGERDWVPLQAYVNVLAEDPNVRHVKFVDAEGVVRAATDGGQVGHAYRPHVGEPVVREQRDLKVTSTRDGFRFVRPIAYAGRTFGTLDIAVSNRESEAAAALSRWLVWGLGLLTMVVVCAVSYAIAALMLRPIERLKMALREGAAEGPGVRIDQLRNDEFGDIFHAFNTYAAAMQERIEADRSQVLHPPVDNLNATRIMPAAAPAPVKIANAR